MLPMALHQHVLFSQVVWVLKQMHASSASRRHVNKQISLWGIENTKAFVASAQRLRTSWPTHANAVLTAPDPPLWAPPLPTHPWGPPPGASPCHFMSHPAPMPRHVAVIYL